MTRLTIDDVKPHRRFVCWKREVVNGKETKVPRMPSGRHAKSNDPATWSTYAECAAVVTQFDGIGIVLGPIDGVSILGVDFDKCCDAFEGKFTPESRKMVIALDSYSEYSVNGYGAHVLCLADFPEEYRGARTGKKADSIVRPGPDFKQIEIKGSGFYFTLSGRHLSKTPADLMPRQDQINALCKRVAGMQKPGIVVSTGNEEEKYRKLMAGDLSDFNGDPSRADLALCNILARRHNNNFFKIDEAWMKSGLFRDKLAEREDYRSATIMKAIKGGALIFDEEEPMEEDTPRVFALKALPGRKEGWLPSGEVSLVGGPSGAGKTHMLVRILEDVRHGLSTFGHTTTTLDYCILLHDRSRAAMKATVEATNAPVDEVMSRVIRLTRAQQKERPASIVEAAIQTRPGVKLWILEGLDFWTPDLHKLDAVGDVLDELQRVAKQYSVAVVGTLGSPKQKENDRYASGRDQFMGSVAFGRKSETCISIEKTSDKSVRKMNVMIRNAAEETFFFTWTDAGIVLTTEPVEQKKNDENSAIQRMEAHVFAATADGEVLKYAQRFGPYATFFRWRKIAQAEGKVTLSGKKWYRTYAGGVECGEAVQ